jgi:uncharacterized OB-fold protein
MHIAQNWRLNTQRYALQGVRCETCGQVTFPPREVCPHCAQEKAQAAARRSHEEQAATVVAFDMRREAVAGKDR